jgi:hypothetical protein
MDKVSRGMPWKTCFFKYRRQDQISVRPAEKELSQALGGEISDLSQSRSQERKKFNHYFEVEESVTDRSICVMSLLPSGHICHSQIATCHLSPHFTLVTPTTNSLASSCLQLPRCSGLHQSSAASLVLAVQRMEPVLFLLALGAAAGDRDAQVRKKPTTFHFKKALILSPGLTLSGLAPSVASSSSAGSRIIE